MGPDTPVSFRWRRKDEGGFRFMAYGWRPHEWMYRSDVPRPKSRSAPTHFYGILSREERDKAACDAGLYAYKVPA